MCTKPVPNPTADSAAAVAVLDAPVAVVAAVGAGREVVAAVAAAVAASPAGSLLSGITTRERLATSLVVRLGQGYGRQPRPPEVCRLYPAAGAVFQERAQPMAAARMAQFAEGLGFNLADALPRNRKILPHFFQRVLTPVFQAKAHLNDLLFARRERLQHLRRLLPQIEIDHRIGR